MNDFHPNLYRLSQSRFAVIPGGPWVYWVSDRLRNMFVTFPILDELAHPAQGLASADNQRFLRYWWEVGVKHLEFNCRSRAEAIKSKKRWFPCMKGGPFKKWFGNQEYVVNWHNDGIEMRAFKKAFIRNDETYFLEGITFTDLSSGNLSMRYLPPGFVYDHAGNSLFPLVGNLWAWLSLLNSNLFGHLMHINPTIHFYIGDFKRMPVPLKALSSDSLTKLAQSATKINLFESFRDETTYLFLSPLGWYPNINGFELSHILLTQIDREIDNLVNDFYDLSAEDRNVIFNEINGLEIEGDDELPPPEYDEKAVLPITSEELAVRWISYAVGIVLGHLQPGFSGRLGSALYRREDFAIGSLPAPDEAEFNELVGAPECFAYIDEQGGRHVFSKDVEIRLCALADSDGVTVLDEGHPDDLPAKVLLALEWMLDEQGVAEVVAAATGKAHETMAALRKFLEKDFFTKWHLKWYRSRPVYWLLQSPKKLYSLYMFHERLTRDTLYLIQGKRYLEGKLNLTRQALAEKRAAVAKAGSARERRALDKEAEELQKLLLDLEEFAKRLKAITDRGYTPHIDDGVILNMAPLYEIIPSWSKEPQKCWEGLERGDYDWAHMAMDYRPEQVRRACKTNKSIAIAHGHEEWYEG